MKKLSLSTENNITFEDGCNLYLDYCKQRNLSNGTIKHYTQSFTQFYKFFEPEIPISKFNEQLYNRYVLYLRNTLNNDISINSYLRDLITVMHYLMNNDYIDTFEMKTIKTSKSNIETYTDDELRILLKKPNIRKCKFIEYQCWVITNFLFCTGVRQRSLMNIKIKDIDFNNNVLYVNVTKNRKPIIIPLNTTLINILKEYLKHRQHKTEEDYLFCNVFGQQLVKSTCYHMLYTYNKNRGVETTGIHRYRHTFAKQWILSGGNVVTLSRLLGHSNLNITENYIHLLVSDLNKQVNEINLLSKFGTKTSIRMK